MKSVELLDMADTLYTITDQPGVVIGEKELLVRAASSLRLIASSMEKREPEYICKCSCHESGARHIVPCCCKCSECDRLYSRDDFKKHSCIRKQHKWKADGEVKRRQYIDQHGYNNG